MTAEIDALKRKFREGRQAEAIDECEALRAREPANRDLLRLCASMHVVTGTYGRALELFRELQQSERDNADVLFNIGLCERELKGFAAAARTFAAYTQKFPAHPDGWASLGEYK